MNVRESDVKYLVYKTSSSEQEIIDLCGGFAMMIQRSEKYEHICDDEGLEIIYRNLNEAIDLLKLRNIRVSNILKILRDDNQSIKFRKIRMSLLEYVEKLHTGVIYLQG